jgi:hypothetical protein
MIHDHCMTAIRIGEGRNLYSPTPSGVIIRDWNQVTYWEEDEWREIAAPLPDGEKVQRWQGQLNWTRKNHVEGIRPRNWNQEGKETQSLEGVGCQWAITPNQAEHSQGIKSTGDVRNRRDCVVFAHHAHPWFYTSL